ncbi:TPA: hypothetical protein N0F65_007528 [Lagenidium giganteum]|uniref:Magnesium-dependent phosphatase-1 n=1 Tax=Lagenidium giganteum TaxID=4803 RepID=A0AAV2ZCZ3_9STRA|nr:TPA: hypothetical protein N0F65_007528 [Lagenidium giganteum]
MARTKAKTKRKGSPRAGAQGLAKPWTYVPKLVVFDLDFTLWYPEMYELDGAPFRKDTATGAVTDRSGEQVHFFPAVHSVLSVLATDPQFKDTTEVATASKTTEPAWAKTCMQLMDVQLEDVTNGSCTARSLQSLADYNTIYPRNKRVHFQELKEQSGVEYEDMLFFDNEYGNIVDVGKLGVVCAYCPQGLSEGSWIQGMDAFQAAKKKQLEG